MEPQGWAGSTAQERRAGFGTQSLGFDPQTCHFALCVTRTAWPTSLTLGFLLLNGG